MWWILGSQQSVEHLQVDLQLQSPRLWTWQKPESCWQRPAPALQVGTSSLPCMVSGGQGGCRDYLQVSSLEWQPSVWEVSSFLVLMTRRAAFCWNLAERVHESQTAPAFKKGSCCENCFPSGEQLFGHLNNKTRRSSPVLLRLRHGERIFRAAGWPG